MYCHGTHGEKTPEENERAFRFRLLNEEQKYEYETPGCTAASISGCINAPIHEKRPRCPTLRAGTQGITAPSHFPFFEELLLNALLYYCQLTSMLCMKSGALRVGHRGLFSAIKPETGNRLHNRAFHVLYEYGFSALFSQTESGKCFLFIGRLLCSLSPTLRS